MRQVEQLCLLPNLLKLLRALSQSLTRLTHGGITEEKMFCTNVSRVALGAWGCWRSELNGRGSCTYVPEHH